MIGNFRIIVGNIAESPQIWLKWFRGIEMQHQADQVPCNIHKDLYVFVAFCEHHLSFASIVCHQKLNKYAFWYV